MGLSGRLMILVGRSLYLGAFYVAQQFAAIAWRRAVRMRQRLLALALQGPKPSCNSVI